ncbi:AraC family transcriptional regulator [Paenibacillus eucommiae]|uniref:AraC-like DNA-binding protein n=1 Tax=Paenibacillus eucommiae TaxID=1355755 RepID=A0ABS4ILP2_9BACL|nr:AraC family transcriptional regulator [Paenibacillus eucommiae]MBP1988488.1 AraC-like DNA-binding protein [Paenibacillus eucommiae]
MKLRNFGMEQALYQEQRKLGGIHPYHHEILYISSGKVRLTWLDQEIHTDGRALFLLPSNVPHELLTFSGGFLYFYFEFEVQENDTFPDLSVVQCWNRLQGSIAHQALNQAPSVEVLFQTMDSLKRIMETELPAHRELVEQIASHDLHKVLLLVGHVLHSSQSQSPLPLPDVEKDKRPSYNYTHSSLKEVVETLMRFMECYYKNTITLHTLSEYVHLNANYLIRIFKEYKGITPFQYLQEIRLQAAYSYLSGSHLPIKEIVTATGFQSIHYFSRAFKQKYGVSPSEWRKTVGHEDQHKNA